MAQIDPGEPQKLKSGESRAFEMMIGDDFSRAATKGLLPKVQALVLTGLKADLPKGSVLTLVVNGGTASCSSFKDGLFTFPLDPAKIRTGVNAFVITVPAETTLNDFAIKVDRQAK